MTVVAEGVETAQQHQKLEALGCDGCQGFYFARPMPASGIDSLLHLPTSGTPLSPGASGFRSKVDEV